MEEKNYLQDQIIYKENYNNMALYVIKEGIVEISQYM